MRIAVLCTDQGVRVPGTKGSSLHVAAITRAYAALGHDVLLLGVAGHGTPDLDCETWLLPHPGRAEGLVQERNKIALAERFALEAAPVLRRFSPDLLHERLALFGDAGLALAAATGSRHVLEVNALLTHEQQQWRELHLVDEAVRREHAVVTGVDHVVTVSEEWAAAVRRLRPDGVTTVPNGVEEELFEEPCDTGRVRRDLGLADHHRMVVFAGTLRPWHGVEHAVAALRHLPDEVRLVVVGGGADPTPLEEAAVRDGVRHRLVLTGQRSHRDTVQIVRSADVAVAPYPGDQGFAFSPLKVFEYLAAGVPFVATDTGQLTSLLRSHGTGIGVRGSDPEALASAVSVALADPALTRRARAAVPQVLAECGWRARAEQVLAAAYDRQAVR